MALAIGLTFRVAQYRLLSIVGNMAYSDNMLVADVLDVVTAKLPPGWRTSTSRLANRKTARQDLIDVILKIRPPGASTGTVLIEAKSRLEPRDVDYLAATLRPTPDEPILIAAPFISPRSRERLRAKGFAYADLTGNILLTLSRPGLFIETTGASENPQPTPRDRKSLKGSKEGIP